MKTISFLANMPSFVIPIANYFDNRDDWVVKLFVSGSEEELTNCVQTSDVLWFEWCNELLLAGLNKMQFKSSKVICRLHSYEIFTQIPAHVDWTKIDHLIFVNESVQKLMRMMDGGKMMPKTLTEHIIPNLVSIDKWDFVGVEEKKNKIASLGSINYKKDSSQLLNISEAISGDFPKHKIHVAGEIQDMRYEIMFKQYMEAVESSKNLVFDGPQKNANGWLEDKKYILNSSLFESFSYSIAEGMLCGAHPLLRNWYGADNVWPNVGTWNTMGDLLSLIEKYEKMDKSEASEIQEQNRQFVIDTYGFSKIIKQIEEIVDC